MSRLIRITVALLLVPPGVALTGCGPSKNEGQPNPDLKAPEVPPASKETRNMGKDDPKDKKK